LGDGFIPKLRSPRSSLNCFLIVGKKYWPLPDVCHGESDLQSYLFQTQHMMRAEMTFKQREFYPRIIRLKPLIARIGLSRSTIYDRMNRQSPRYDATFPRSVKLGPGAVGWIESEITAWLEQRMAA
jgi:prophage regulatory protein